MIMMLNDETMAMMMIHDSESVEVYIKSSN